jgi:hypothetical protein
MRGDRQKTVAKCCLSEAETDRNANIPCRSAGIWEFAPEIFAPPTGRTANFQSHHSDDSGSLLNVMRKRDMDWENPQILKLIRLVAQSAWRYERDSAH